MKVAIKTKYLGARERVGSRIMAFAMQDGRQLKAYTPYDNKLGVVENHTAALAKLAGRLGWIGDYAMGSTPDGYVFVCVRPPMDNRSIELHRVINEQIDSTINSPVCSSVYTPDSNN